jgi:LCP family protein required for cell wall assembly
MGEGIEAIGATASMGVWMSSLMRQPAHIRKSTPPAKHGGAVVAGAGDPLVRRVRRRRLVAFAALLAVAVLVIGAVLPVVRLRNNLHTSALPGGTPTTAAPAKGQPLNVLVLGSDSRDLDSGDFGPDGEGQRSDAMVLVHLATDDTRIDAVQLPRDTVTDLPPCEDTGRGAFAGGHGMLNSALNYGSACSVLAVQKLTGLRIDHAIEMDFDGFAAMVDALGGLDVCLTDPLDDPRADLDLPAGRQQVDGKQALALARTRHAVGDGSDIARMDHQQMVMSAVVQDVTDKKILTRPDKLYPFLDATTSSLTVDPQLDSVKALAGLAGRVATVDPADITFETMPWAPDPEDPNRVVPADEASDVFDRLGEDAPMVPPHTAHGSSGGHGSAAKPPSGSGSEGSRQSSETSSKDAAGTRKASQDICSG